MFALGALSNLESFSVIICLSALNLILQYIRKKVTRFATFFSLAPLRYALSI
jgi:hypothetical protein